MTAGLTELMPVSFPALGTTASVLVTDPDQQAEAAVILHRELEAIDMAASRFRPDSELSALNEAGARPLRVSDLLFRAVTEALRAAELTDGLVDPTIGSAITVAGYDRDFAEVPATGPSLNLVAKRVPGWRAIRTDLGPRTIQVPAGVRLDLGATAKALCADLTAERIHDATRAGTLVALGGDLAMRGAPPSGGWSVRVAANHAEPPAGARGPIISVKEGGLATSSTSVRRWIRGDFALHHLIDPSTGLPAAEHWCTVTVAAASCLDANIASCASILLGEKAPAWLEERRLPARLVDPRGSVTLVGGFPAC